MGDIDANAYDIMVSSQAGAPSSTPTRIGLTNVDTTNDIIYKSTDTASSADWKISTGIDKGDFTAIIGDGVNVITTGAKKIYKTAPYSGTITAARLLADQSGSVVVDIWVDTYANFPPTVADTITAAAKPTLSGAQKYEDTTLTGWTKTVTKGDVFEINIDSVATITKLTIELDIDKTGD